MILLLAGALGALAVKLGQPPVVGEILAGILFGPTLFHGAITHALFPSDVRSLLSSMSSVGVALFMFCVGLEIEHRFLRGRGRLTAGAALGSTLVPFALGIPLGLFLLQDRTVGRPAAFVVFIGLSVSVTAFPVLARILNDRGLSRTHIGGIALATAAVVDVVAWSGLAAIQAVCGGGTWWQVTFVVPFIAVLALVVRPLLRHVLVPRSGELGLSPGRMSVVLIGAMLSGAATEMMGLHYIFGSFLFGVAIPREGSPSVRAAISGRTGQIASLLLPVYFVVAGFNVNLNGVDSSRILQFVAILLVAVASKFGGTYLGARTQGLEPRPAMVLAALMNTRGLTELIILGVGLQLGLLDGALYSMLVLMALVTTAMSGPLLTWMYRRPVKIDPPAGAASGEPAPAGQASVDSAKDATPPRA